MVAARLAAYRAAFFDVSEKSTGTKNVFIFKNFGKVI
jgi:hypothetical protein